MRRFAYCTQFKGFTRCELSSLRHTILNFKESIKGYDGVREAKIPVLVIWGTADKTMPYYQAATMQKVLPDMKLITYQGSGHIFLYDEGERTMCDVLPFLAE
ncbi:MAG: alpha/beta hydrolase, partial [Clostridia bacterium]|nr:alpha/beta hydrolase [Clostridia bacterium]